MSDEDLDKECEAFMKKLRKRMGCGGTLTIIRTTHLDSVYVAPTECFIYSAWEYKTMVTIYLLTLNSLI